MFPAVCQPVNQTLWQRGTRVTYGLLELRVFILSVDEVLDDVEHPSEHDGEEQTEPSQIDVALGTTCSTD